MLSVDFKHMIKPTSRKIKSMLLGPFISTRVSVSDPQHYNKDMILRTTSFWAKIMEFFHKTAEKENWTRTRV